MVEQIIKDLLNGTPGKLVEVSVEDALTIPYDELVISGLSDDMSGMMDMPAGWSADYESGMGESYLPDNSRLFQYIPAA